VRVQTGELADLIPFTREATVKFADRTVRLWEVDSCHWEIHTDLS